MAVLSSVEPSPRAPNERTLSMPGSTALTVGRVRASGTTSSGGNGTLAYEESLGRATAFGIQRMTGFVVLPLHWKLLKRSSALTMRPAVIGNGPGLLIRLPAETIVACGAWPSTRARPQAPSARLP